MGERWPLNDKTAFLGKTDLLSEVPTPLLTRISDVVEEISVKEGEVIFREGDVGDAVYLVVEGRLGLEANGVRLFSRGKGQWVGEFALIDNAPRSASAVAETDISLLKWTRADFTEALTHSGEVARSVFKLLTGKLRDNVAIQVESALEKERWRQDLKRANEIQRAMLPTQDLATDKAYVSGYCRPAAHVGGDYFDYLLLGDDNLGIILADVMGHGFYAGLLVAMAKSCLHTQATIDYSPAAVMEAMNRIVFHSVQTGLLMTCCYVLIDLRENRLTYTNAGHPYPFHYRANSNCLERLSSTDTLLGVPGLEETRFSTEQRSWDKGDLLVLFSDGLPEAEDGQEQDFGEERVGRIILENKAGSPTHVKDCLLAALSAHCRGLPQNDDISLVVGKSV